MENEKKGKKILEIILIVLVSLSFVLIPLLNQYRQKTISLNRSQLVNRQNVRNGNIDITDYQNGDVYTISAYFESYYDYNFEIDPITIDEYKSLTDVNDVFGWGIPNYFRFYPSAYNLPNSTFEMVLQFYIQLDSSNFKTYNLAYYDVNTHDNDDGGDCMSYYLIPKTEFANAGILARYDVLNISYYDATCVDNFIDSVFSIGVLARLFNIDTNYQLRSNYFSFIHGSNVHFINIDKDTITSLISTIETDSYHNGYQTGYNDGYNVGFNESSSNEGVFSMLKHAANSLIDLMNIEILPNISLWLLISIPLSISIMLIMFKLLRGGN